MKLFVALLLPLLGTTLGASCVFFLKKDLKSNTEKALTGFAGGVMVAASIWSLLDPAMEMSAQKGKWSFLPAVIGFWVGILFLLALDRIIPHLHKTANEPEGKKSNFAKSSMLFLAVALHNNPEGLAVGVIYAGYLMGNGQINFMQTFVLALGVAIQNFPEGAIISMPLSSQGMKKGKAFFLGFLSGVVEPIGSLITIAATALVVPILPYLLSFAAGAMMYVVVEELIPDMSKEPHSNIGTVLFAVGFTLMLALDVALG